VKFLRNRRSGTPRGKRDRLPAGRPHLTVGERIEVHQLRRLGLDFHGVEKLAVHVEAHLHRLGVGGALAGEAETMLYSPSKSTRWLASTVL
jgi:hypothetical protein